MSRPVLTSLVEWKHNVFLQKSSITSDAWLEVMLMLCSQSYIDSYLFVAPADISVRCCARQKHPSLCSHTVCDCGKEEIVCVLHHFVHSQNYFSGVSVGICVHNEAHNFFLHTYTYTNTHTWKFCESLCVTLTPQPAILQLQYSVFCMIGKVVQ